MHLLAEVRNGPTPMITITAVIRVKLGTEQIMREAFEAVARFVQKEEPEAISFFISSGIVAPNVFATYERFVDRAAMEAHNNSEVVKKLHRIAGPILDGPIVLEIGEEIFTKDSAVSSAAR